MRTRHILRADENGIFAFCPNDVKDSEKFDDEHIVALLNWMHVANDAKKGQDGSWTVTQNGQSTPTTYANAEAIANTLTGWWNNDGETAYYLVSIEANDGTNVWWASKRIPATGEVADWNANMKLDENGEYVNRDQNDENVPAKIDVAGDWPR